jgi:hypothetical protein
VRLRLFGLFTPPLLALLVLILGTGLFTALGAATRATAIGPPREEDTRVLPGEIQSTLSISTGVELLNPGFEEGWANTACDVYNADGSFLNSQTFSEISVPDGWTAFYKSGLPVEHDPKNSVGWARPETQVIPNEAPFLDPPRIDTGQQAFKLFTFYRIHDAGLFQQIRVSPGGRLKLSASVHAWTSEDDDPHHSKLGDVYQASQMVGLDPTGGTNPFADSVVWSEPDHIYDVYTQTHSVEAMAQNITLTVFVRSWVKWPYKHNDLYWDTVSLELVDLPYSVYLPFTTGKSYVPRNRWGVYLPFVSKPGPPPPPPPPKPSASGEFGVVFVNPADPGSQADEGRYNKAADLGIGWDRWPMYWYHVEPSEGAFNWAAYDPVVEADLSHGLQVNAILMGTPGFYATQGIHAPAPPLGYRVQGDVALLSSASPPRGLYEPVFSDGSDVPGSSKSINPNNPWARMVYRVVERYRPGGELGQQKGWPADRGVRVWEIWNEPDLSLFWNGSVADYTRLLKVAALAARQADPGAVIMTAGLADRPAPGYLTHLLAQLAQDPNPSLRDSQGWYFDAVALHNYAWSWDTGERVRQARQALNNYSAVKDRPIWINESGVSVYDDYPGPTWQQNGEANYMATMEEQAAYTIQNAAFALYNGAAVIFHFQLYDGCGNDPAGTDFPPDARYLCDQGQICASASAFGLWRNKPTDSCYRQHSQPDTARPAFSAFRTAVQALTGAQPVWHRQPGGDQERFAFFRPDTKQRIVVLWAREYHATTAQVPAVAGQATLLDQYGNPTTLHPSNGSYSISLPAATNRNLPIISDSVSSIGGRTYLLIESWNGP